MVKEKFTNFEFRIACLHPVYENGTPLTSGTIISDGKKSEIVNISLCSHGIGMTLEEMNNNLILKESPFIKIEYCKYCYHSNSIGVFDESNETFNRKMGFIIQSPEISENGIFEKEITDENLFNQFFEN